MINSQQPDGHPDDRLPEGLYGYRLRRRYLQFGHYYYLCQSGPKRLPDLSQYHPGGGYLLAGTTTDNSAGFVAVQNIPLSIHSHFASQAVVETPENRSYTINSEYSAEIRAATLEE